MKREYPHTALPWRRSGGCIMDVGRNLIATRYSYTVINEDGCIQDMREGYDAGTEGGISPCEADSNAALIDIACNYHDDLVTLAERITDTARTEQEGGDMIAVSAEAFKAVTQLLEEIETVRKAGDR